MLISYHNISRLLTCAYIYQSINEKKRYIPLSWTKHTNDNQVNRSYAVHHYQAHAIPCCTPYILLARFKPNHSSFFFLSFSKNTLHESTIHSSMHLSLHGEIISFHPSSSPFSYLSLSPPLYSFHWFIHLQSKWAYHLLFFIFSFLRRICSSRYH